MPNLHIGELIFSVDGGVDGIVLLDLHLAGPISHLQSGDGAVGVLNHLGGIGVERYLNRCLILIFDSYAITGPVKTCYRDTRQLLLIKAIARLGGQGQQPMVHPIQVGREIVA